VPGKKLKAIRGVEIFSAGVWNGDEYNEKDLDEMVRAFNETSKTFRPALKLGHDEKQAILQNDGLPAAGWVGALYRIGKKLLADFIDIPEKVHHLLERGAYKRVSSEVFWNTKINDADYRRVLGAVALLGADMPGVTCLSDIFQMYDLQPLAVAEVVKVHTEKDQDRHTYAFDEKTLTIEKGKQDLHKGDHGMTQEEFEKLKADLDAEQKKNHSLVTEKTSADTELADLRKFKIEQEVKLVEAEKVAAQAILDKEVSELVSQHLVTPAMKPYVLALIGEEKKEYSFGEGTKEKKFSKHGLLKEILKLHSASESTVNSEESSVDHEVETGATDSEKALDQEIQKYALDNTCSYKIAYKAVLKAKADTTEEESEDESDSK